MTMSDLSTSPQNKRRHSEPANLRSSGFRRRSSLWTLYEYSVDDYLDQNPQSLKEQCLFVLIVLGFILSGLLFVISGPILCCFRLTRLARLVILWLWLVMLAIIVSLLLRFGLYVGDSYTIALGDAKPLPKGLTPLFCTGVNTKSLDVIHVYANDGLPPLSDNLTTLAFTRSWSLREHNFLAKKLYLLEGSEFNIKIKLQPDNEEIDFYFIESASNLHSWQKDKNCACYLEKRVVKKSAIIDRRITDRDDYYMVFDFPKAVSNWEIEVSINMTLHRRDFAYSALSRTCSSSICNFAFSPFSSDIVIARAPPYWRSIGVTTTCNSNTITYTLIFVCLPVVIGLVLSLFIWFYCDTEIAEENFPILGRMGSYSEYSPGLPHTGRLGSRNSGFKAIFEGDRTGEDDMFEEEEAGSVNSDVGPQHI